MSLWFTPFLTLQMDTDLSQQRFVIGLLPMIDTYTFMLALPPYFGDYFVAEEETGWRRVNPKYKDYQQESQEKIEQGRVAHGLMEPIKGPVSVTTLNFLMPHMKGYSALSYAAVVHSILKNGGVIRDESQIKEVSSINTYNHKWLTPCVGVTVKELEK